MRSVPNLIGHLSIGFGDFNLSSDVYVKVPDGLYGRIGNLPASTALAPQAVYNGGFTSATEICVRIANGGAGQSGLIGAWANAFIQHSVNNLGKAPFLVR